MADRTGSRSERGPAFPDICQSVNGSTDPIQSESVAGRLVDKKEIALGACPTLASKQNGGSTGVFAPKFAFGAFLTDEPPAGSAPTRFWTLHENRP